MHEHACQAKVRAGIEAAGNAKHRENSLAVAEDRDGHGLAEVLLNEFVDRVEVGVVGGTEPGDEVAGLETGLRGG